MPIVNNSVSANEQKERFMINLGPSLISGSTIVIGPIPYPSVLTAVAVGAVTSSATSSSSVEVARFIPGSGFTTISGLGASFVIPQIGVSGMLSVSLTTAGSTLLLLQSGDFLQFRVNAGVNMGAFECIVQKTQPQVTYFGATV